MEILTVNPTENQPPAPVNELVRNEDGTLTLHKNGKSSRCPFIQPIHVPVKRGLTEGISSTFFPCTSQCAHFNYNAEQKELALTCGMCFEPIEVNIKEKK
jgi:hypothetical protein